MLFRSSGKNGRCLDIARAPFLMAGMILLAHASVALDKEISLVTRQPIGELAVAGRLSVDLHAEFMVSRSYGTETVLNWYNCGYSGGGGKDGKVTTVGGNFGDFGFQVPYADRERRYPRAVTIDKVRAVHFDGNNFLKGNFPAESKIAGARGLALEVWFRSGTPAKGDMVLGWQSRDGKETSASLVLPAGFTGSGMWRHLLVNCTPETEDWYLDGIKISSGKRGLLIREGHIMVLGGASASQPSFKGDLAAVRLHDETMTGEEIAHNFAGGVMLGTAMQNWWRTEPDKWYVVESEHFRHAVDREDMKKWDARGLKEFTERVPGMFRMAELIYHIYSERLAMRSSVVSRMPEHRGDGIKYKTPIQPTPGNSVMGCDDNFGWACQFAGFINPHELVHGWDAQTGGMAGNYWEVHANFPQTFAGIYQQTPVSTVWTSHLFPANGRTYYGDQSLFQHLAQTPEYGPMFIAKLWYDGPTQKGESPYPWITFNRVNPYPDRTLAVEHARMAMRNVTWDYVTYVEARDGLGGNTLFGNDGVVSGENIFRREWNQPNDRNNRHGRAILEKIPYEPEWWRVPKSQAPQQLGYNICPLKFKPGKVSATLAGYVDENRGGDWRAGFVGVDRDGKPVYGNVFAPGTVEDFDVTDAIRELYLVVSAVPRKIVDIDMCGDFRSFAQEPFPYKVKLQGCEPLDVLVPVRPDVPGKRHVNGGGFVADSAKADATAYVGPKAQVLGNAVVTGKARIEDFAVVRDNARVSDSAIVSGHALVMESATVSGNAKIRDYAKVKNRTAVSGMARVLEHATIDTDKACTDRVTVKGSPYVYGGSLGGTTMIDGFYAKGQDSAKGKWFTWSWGSGKNPGESDEDFGGLYAAYDFDSPHGWMAIDSFGATWGFLVNGAKVEIIKGRKGEVPAEMGVLSLNGRDQFVELPKDVSDLRDATIKARVLWEGGANERIFEFSNDRGDLAYLTPSANRRCEFVIRAGSTEQRLAGPELARGKWTALMLVLREGHAFLVVDGKVVSETNAMKLHLEDIAATECTLGRGRTGAYFKGMIDNFVLRLVGGEIALPRQVL